MVNLKNLMGDAYHDGITVEEVNSFLEGKNLVDLKTGKYVDKDKFDTLKKKHDELAEKTKDYDEVKANNEKHEAEKKDADLNSRLKNLGFNEKALKYVKGDITDGSLKISDDEKQAKKDVEAYLKEHPNFASQSAPITTDPKSSGKIIGTSIGSNGEGEKKSVNSVINQGILNACGKSKPAGASGE